MSNFYDDNDSEDQDQEGFSTGSKVLGGLILGSFMAVRNHNANEADKRNRASDDRDAFEADKRAHGGVGRGETDPETGVKRYF